MSDIDLGDIATTASAAFALGSLVVAGVAARIAVKAKRAAEDSAAASKRSADAAEAQNRLAEDQDARYDPVWETAKSSGGTMAVLRRAVINRTGENAYQVRVSGPGITPVESPQVLAGEGLTFDYQPPRVPHERKKPSDERSQSSVVVVRWQRPPYRGSADQEWRGDLSVL